MTTTSVGALFGKAPNAENPQEVAKAYLAAALAGDVKKMLSLDVDYAKADAATQAQKVEEYERVGIQEQFKGATFTVGTLRNDPERGGDAVVDVELTLKDGTVQRIPLPMVKWNGKWYVRNGS